MGYEEQNLRSSLRRMPQGAAVSANGHAENLIDICRLTKKVEYMKIKPTVSGPARLGKSKYNWPSLKKQGWLFVFFEDGHAAQDKSLRSAARAQGLSVSVRRARSVEGGATDGWLVELV